MQTIIIKRALDVLQESPAVIAAGRLPTGESMIFASLGSGVEATITAPGGTVTHRIFHSVYEFMLWYVEHYVERGSI